MPTCSFLQFKVTVTVIALLSQDVPHRLVHLLRQSEQNILAPPDLFVDDNRESARCIVKAHSRLVPDLAVIWPTNVDDRHGEAFGLEAGTGGVFDEEGDVSCEVVRRRWEK